MTEKIYLETFEKCPGPLRFSLLIFKTLAYLMTEGYSKPSQILTMMRHIENRGLEHFIQAYSVTFSSIQSRLGILRDIKVYSGIIEPC